MFWKIKKIYPPMKEKRDVWGPKSFTGNEGAKKFHRKRRSITPVYRWGHSIASDIYLAIVILDKDIISFFYLLFLHFCLFSISSTPNSSK